MDSRNDFRAQLSSLGVPSDRPLMVHVGMRQVGGRAEDLVTALVSHLTPSGTLLVVLGADEDTPFDAATTEVDVDDLGVFAEIFRRHPDTRVNDHAAARFGAIGKDVATLFSDTPLDDYFGPSSVLEKLVQKDGAVLRIGASDDTVTLTHHAEYLAVIPTKRRVRRRYVRADTGEQWIESLDDNDGIVDWEGGDYFAQIWRDFSVTPAVRHGSVGRSAAQWFDAAAFVTFAVAWLEQMFAE